jgi:hypothetical protein
MAENLSRTDFAVLWKSRAEHYGNYLRDLVYDEFFNHDGRHSHLDHSFNYVLENEHVNRVHSNTEYDDSFGIRKLHHRKRNIFCASHQHHYIYNIANRVYNFITVYNITVYNDDSGDPECDLSRRLWQYSDGQDDIPARMHYSL